MTAREKAIRAAALQLALTDPADTAALNAARRASCEAKGLQAWEIDPVTGHDLSLRSYELVRDTWRRHGPLNDYSRPHFDKAYAYWAERRPDWVAGDDWTPRGDEGDQ